MLAPSVSRLRRTATGSGRAGAEASTGMAEDVHRVGAAFHVAGLMGAVLLAGASRPWVVSPALAWVAFVPTFHLVLAAAARRRHLLAAGCGAFAALGVTSVAYEATLGLSVQAYLVVAVMAALPFGAACGAAAFVSGRLTGGARRLAWLVLPVFWCCAELLLRQEWLSGAWAPALAVIGYSQAETSAVHLARFGSVTAVSLAVLLANALALEAVRRGVASVRAPHGAALTAFKAALPPAAGLGLLCLIVLAAAAGAPTGASPDGTPALSGGRGGGLRLIVVQPNLPATVRAAAAADGSLATELLAALAAGSRSASTETPTVAVWPEGIWPGRLTRPSTTSASRTSLTSEQRLALSDLPPLLLGAASHDEEAGTYGNSAFALIGGDLAHAADKRRLVPFAEAGLAAGATPGLVELSGVTIAPVICYDVAFPATVRAAVLGGARLLAVMTDDTFAAGGGVPLQHLRVARLRAVENGVWLAFASNGGPSAIVDPAGRIVERATPRVVSALEATVRPLPGSTPYARYGDWVGALTCLLAVGLAAAAGRMGGGYRRSPSA